MPVRARTAAVGAGLLSGLLVLVWFAAFHIPVVEHADRAILEGFGGIGHHPRVSGLAGFVARLCNPSPYVFLCVVPVAVAVIRGRRWVAVAIAAILLGANVSTELLKPLLAQPRPDGVAWLPALTGSWPSGHATAAMSLALSCVLAAPARWRSAVAAAGAGFAIAVSYSFLSLEWHYPSDVLGGFLVAAVWTLLAIAGLLAAGERRELDLSRRLTVTQAVGPPLAALAGAVLLLGVVVVARPHEVVAWTSVHKTFVAGAAAIAALGVALATGVALALRR